MYTDTKKNLPISLLRCVQKSAPNEVCRGDLNLTNDTLTCSLCSYQYKQVHGVPVLKSEVIESSDTWFEQMYADRSRTLELASNYLRPEREFMDRFVKEHNIQGPCLEIGCGVGLFAEIVPDFIGLEYSLESLLSNCSEVIR